MISTKVLIAFAAAAGISLGVLGAATPAGAESRTKVPTKLEEVMSVKPAPQGDVRYFGARLMKSTAAGQQPIAGMTLHFEHGFAPLGQVLTACRAVTDSQGYAACLPGNTTGYVHVQFDGTSVYEASSYSTLLS